MNYLNLEQLQTQALADGKLCVVGALISNREGHIFVQKRTAQRALFAGCWDIVGGHVEIGESLRGALARETYEETGWRLSQVTDLIDTFDWKANGVERREFDFLVEVSGGLQRPTLETSKVSTCR